MIESYTVTKEIEICPKCGIFGLADGVCDYCGYDRITEYVESRIRKEFENISGTNKRRRGT